MPATLADLHETTNDIEAVPNQFQDRLRLVGKIMAAGRPTDKSAPEKPGLSGFESGPLAPRAVG